MNTIKHFSLPVFALALAGLLAAPARANPDAAAEPVTASFQRMLDHEPSNLAPATPSDAMANTLEQAICMVLWQSPAPSFHVVAGNNPPLIAQATR